MNAVWMMVRSPEASFTNAGGNSLDTVELVMEFEKAFNPDSG
jgi:acyl carrier protein